MVQIVKWCLLFGVTSSARVNHHQLNENADKLEATDTTVASDAIEATGSTDGQVIEVLVATDYLSKRRSNKTSSEESGGGQFECPKECRECGHGRGLPHQKKYKKQFTCVLKKPFESAEVPAGRNCECPYREKCDLGPITRESPGYVSKRRFNDIADNNLGKTQCDFTKEEVRGKAWNAMLTKKNWVSENSRCCCSKKSMWSEAKCLPMDAKPKKGTKLWVADRMGVETGGKKLFYGKAVVADGGLNDDGSIPIEGGGELPAMKYHFAIQAQSTSAGKVESYTVLGRQQFPNRNTPCLRAKNYPQWYQKTWDQQMQNTGCCIKTRQRIHNEQYPCGQDCNSDGYCSVRYCTRQVPWTACASWEHLFRCGGVQQTGHASVRVDDSPGICIGDRSTPESLRNSNPNDPFLEQHLGSNHGKKIGLRYAAKSGKQKQCPLGWEAFKMFGKANGLKGSEFLDNSVGSVPWYCSCEHACQRVEDIDDQRKAKMNHARNLRMTNHLLNTAFGSNGNPGRRRVDFGVTYGRSYGESYGNNGYGVGYGVGYNLHVPIGFSAYHYH